MSSCCQLSHPPYSGFALERCDAAAASSTEGDTAGVFTQVAPLSVPLKWASTSANSAAQCRLTAAQCRCEPTPHAPFFQAAQVQ